MAKNLTHWSRWALGGALALASVVPWTDAGAKQLLNENFDYSAGNLYGKGGWVKYGSNPEAPIQVSDANLTYTGYQTEAVGGMASIAKDNLAEDLMKNWGEAISTGEVYVSFLCKVNNIDNVTTAKNSYFFSIVPQMRDNAWADKKSPDEIARCFVAPGSSEGKIKFGVSRYQAVANAAWAETEVNLGETCLIVMKYKFVDSDTNDEIYLWINPDISAAAPSADALYDKAIGKDAPFGLYGVQLRQGNSTNNPGPAVDIDAVRAGTEWADLFPSSSGGGDEEPPALRSTDQEMYVSAYQGFAVQQTATIKGKNLKGDVTVVCPEGVTCDTPTLSKEDVMSTEGAKVVFTIPDPQTEKTYNIVLNTEGADPFNMTLTAYVTACTKVDNLSALRGVEGMYGYGGTAIVTAIESTGYDNYNIYAQDETGGVKMVSWSDTGAPFAIGDRITGFVGWTEPELGAPKVSNYKEPDLVAHGEAAVPVVVAAGDITSANAAEYIYRLVQVKGLSFTDPADKTFSTKFVDATGANGAGVRIKAMIGSDLIGQALPAAPVDVTGLSFSTSAFTMAVPFASYIEEAAVSAPTIIADQTLISLQGMLQGTSATATVNLKATDLTGDVTVTCPAGITCDKTTVTKEEAMAEAGVDLNFTITPVAVGPFTGKVTLASEGAQDVVLTFEVEDVYKVITLANSTAVMNQLDDPDLMDNTYRYTGKAVITYIEKCANGYSEFDRIYAQDMFGGLCINTEYAGANPFKVGDEISNFYCVMQAELGAPTMFIITVGDGPMAEVTAEGKTKTPTTINISEITAATAPQYLYRLVKLEGVTFQPKDGQTQFSATETVTVSDGDKTAVARAMQGSDVVGAEIPLGTVTVTGISQSAAQLTLGIGKMSDIEAGAPEVTITPEKMFDFANNAAAVGEKTEIYKYTVNAQSIKAEAPVMITGADAAMFSVEPASIPAGNSNTVVTVYYQPTSVGMHKGNVFFDFDGTSSELNQTMSLGTCKAYDPQNMPAVTITPSEVELIAKPGEKVTAEVKLTGSGCFDYITGARQGTGDNGGITVSSTYMLPDSKDAPIIVTFQPKAEGEFSETFVYTTTLCATPATLTIKAVCKGEIEPQPVEGQPFELSTADPQPWYTQDFMSVEKNKPLSIEGWTNSAIEGQRAWWGYVSDGDDVFHAAKCTAYDSQIASGKGLKDQQMILASPALDYLNAKTKTLKFRLMGQFLTKGSGDVLEICLIEPSADGFDIHPMDGFSIPATEDESGTWIPYEVDMSQIPSMPEVFFIGFRFNYTRGSDNATAYYITDFVWSDKSEGVDGVISDAAMFAGAKADADGLYSVYNMQGMLVKRTASAADVLALPAGIYIAGGKKVCVK